MARFAFNSISVELPVGWGEITDNVEADEPPFTLAHDDGVGALQFSTAIYKSGVVPNSSLGDLLELLQDFGDKQELEDPSEVVTEVGPPVLAAGTFDWVEDCVIRVWYVSDGLNFAFITYTCSNEHVGPELAVCEQIVRSIQFHSQ